jgi:Flp pilus assembly protein TadD
MKDFSALAFLLLSFAALALAGCEASPVHLDPQSVNGRDGGGPTPSYAALMRIGAAARSGGDLPNALSVFRRAAEMAPFDPTPYVAAGDVLLEMGSANEAIVTYNAALSHDARNLPALAGLAKAYLMTSRPELALEPVSKALAESPEDPKLLLLLGVTRDLAGQHGEAQAYYRSGLARAPGDPGLTVDLALSLTLSGDYPNAIAVLQPLALASTASAQERQTLALIYGLKGSVAEAARISRIDLDETVVAHNLTYYQTLRELSPEARNRAILSAGSYRGGARPS